MLINRCGVVIYAGGGEICGIAGELRQNDGLAPMTTFAPNDN
jgi:hypothetical protein